MFHYFTENWLNLGKGHCSNQENRTEQEKGFCILGWEAYMYPFSLAFSLKTLNE